MLKYLFIVFIVFLALAPLSHFVPSKRQRRLARMREEAALSGLFVEFRNLPGTQPAPDVRPGELIYYGKRLPPARREGAASGHWRRVEEGWRAGTRGLATPALLDELPADVLAAGVDAGSCGVYWIESAREEDVADISAALGRWADQICGAEQPSN